MLGQTAGPGGGALGVLGRDRSRVHELDVIAGREVLGGVSEAGLQDAVLPQSGQERGAGPIGAAHLRAQSVSGAGVAAHAGAADPDEVQPAIPPRERLGGCGPGRGHDAAASSSAAMSCAAWGRARPLEASAIACSRAGSASSASTTPAKRPAVSSASAMTTAAPASAIQ